MNRQVAIRYKNDHLFFRLFVCPDRLHMFQPTDRILEEINFNHFFIFLEDFLLFLEFQRPRKEIMRRF